MSAVGTKNDFIIMRMLALGRRRMNQDLEQVKHREYGLGNCGSRGQSSPQKTWLLSEALCNERHSDSLARIGHASRRAV
jgi:hypothetical protein